MACPVIMWAKLTVAACTQVRIQMLRVTGSRGSSQILLILIWIYGLKRGKTLFKFLIVKEVKKLVKAQQSNARLIWGLNLNVVFFIGIAHKSVHWTATSYYDQI